MLKWYLNRSLTVRYPPWVSVEDSASPDRLHGPNSWPEQLKLDVRWDD